MTALLPFLRRYGPQPAAALRDALQVSSSTLSRATKDAGDALLVVGRARATSYAARRTVDGLRSPTPVYEADEHGELRELARLHPVEPFGWYCEAAGEAVPSGWHGTDPRTPDAKALPWWLRDLQPQGFFGRAWLKRHPDHGFPADLRAWTGDDVLRWAAAYGEDAPGALFVGPVARDRWLGEQPAVPSDDAALPELAEACQAGEVGSSAGGEQPKFTRTWRHPDGTLRPELVKFSPPVDAPGGRRWADLLVAEHLAHVTLAEAGLPACTSRIVAAGRLFLCVDRFDRVGHRGRRGVASLSALDDGPGHDIGRWTTVTAHLVAAGRIGAAVHAQAAWLQAFGDAIANTDMHLGNLSLLTRGDRLVGLAPVYDMLPMADAPRFGGEVLPDRWRPPTDLPADVAAAARRFWRRVAEDDRVSADYRALAARRAA
jgi:hypothetical protein